MDRLFSMEVFVRVAEAPSFAAAAGSLGLSRQMVAKHIAFLERRVGTSLLTRTTRQQSLTEFGHRYLEQCRLVLAEAAAADALADELHGRPRGTLRVNAPVTFGTFSLVPLLLRFLREHPEVDVDLVLDDRLVDLAADRFEAVFRLGPLADSTFKARTLAPYRLIACAAPSYLRAHGVPSVPADLADHECLGFAYWSRPLAGTWRFTRNGREEAVAIHGRLRANDGRALLAAALDGFGIALGAEALLRPAMDAGRLVPVLPEWHAPSRPMHLIYPASRRQTPKLRLFLAAVMAAFGTKAKPPH